MNAFLLSALLLLLPAPASTIKNFDQQVTQGSPFIIIEPPAGKVWTIQRASFALEFPVPGTAVWVFEEQLGDPRLRENLVRVDTAVFSLVPIVGGYVQQGTLPVLKGQDAAIELRFPSRLVIAVLGIQEGDTLNTWTRATINETDEVRRDRQID